MSTDLVTVTLSEMPETNPAGEKIEVEEDLESGEIIEDAETVGSPTRRARRFAPVGRSSRLWTRLAVLAGGLVVLAGVAFGVYRLTRPADTALNPAAGEAARQTVVQFFEASRTGDKSAVLGLFTDQAQEQIRRGNRGPEADLVRPGVTHEVGDAVVTEDRAEVPVIEREAGQEQHMVFKLRRQGKDWRIYGVSVQLIADDPQSRVNLDFENPQNTLKDLFGEDMEDIGPDWANNFKKDFNQGFEDGFKSAPRPEDLANEALAPMDRAAFEAIWKADLDVKARPAGEVLEELADAMGVTLETTPVQDRALARPITLRIAGRSRAELAEEVCKRVGLYPVLEEQFGGPGKPGEKLTLRSTPRPYPVVFAGPFTVEVEEVAEYVPHATGLITLRLRAANMPPVVMKMLGSFQDAKVVQLTQVADSKNRDLSDAPTGPRRKLGRVLPDRYDRTLEIPLKNLLRNVTAVKTFRGVVRIPLPEKVETLRFEPAKAGAVTRAGEVEVKLATFQTSQTTINGKQYPNANFRLDYKGVRPDRVRALAYDAQKKLLAVSSSGWSGRDQGGTGDFSVLGEPAAIVVKVISVVEYAEYEFALDDILLPGAVGMPEKLIPAEFPGHDAPVSVEFVRITSAGFPAKGQFRLINHSNKDVRLVDLKLVYLDAAGRELSNWPNTSYTDQIAQEMKGPPLAVGKKATAIVEIDSPFLPETAKSIRASVNKLEYSDATEWVPPKK